MKVIIDIPKDLYYFICSEYVIVHEGRNSEKSVMAILLSAIKKSDQEPHMTNFDWIGFLSKQFDISRTSAKEMLHVMMSVKKEDNFKKQFSGRKVIK